MPWSSQSDGPVVFLGPEVLSGADKLIACPPGARKADSSKWNRHASWFPAGCVVCLLMIGYGLMNLPKPPEGAPYRAMLYKDPSMGWRVLQHCVSAPHETVESMNIRQIVPGACYLFAIASPRWLVWDLEKAFDSKGRCSRSYAEWPLLAATHKHRRIRGTIRVSTGAFYSKLYGSLHS